MRIFITVLLAITGFLVGSVNFAVVFSGMKHKDIRKLGSGNPGTMNVLRSVGKGSGVATFVCDCLKGTLTSLIGLLLYDATTAMILGLVTVLGHVFSLFLAFKGGKGVATSIGVFFVLTPIAAAVTFVLFLLYLAVFKVGFIGSLGAILILTVACSVRYRQNVAVICMAIALFLLVVYTHRANFVRLARGKENSLSLYNKDSSEAEEAEDGNIGEKEE